MYEYINFVGPFKNVTTKLNLAMLTEIHPPCLCSTILCNSFDNDNHVTYERMCRHVIGRRLVTLNVSDLHMTKDYTLIILFRSL